MLSGILMIVLVLDFGLLHSPRGQLLWQRKFTGKT